ncbi:Protein SKT5 [Fusarium oxysporum f. sp. cubense race 1]|uniref:Protein SKT5 n=1 Tax=Fusarium oxysporum f. sp. cubense (strain race 1) TaxID=1229664 RepID=N4TBN4_FUSC1|nr:Protein SKT5 [Fusarium oxysporum f. sp. cubense race 1]
MAAINTSPPPTAAPLNYNESSRPSSRPTSASRRSPVRIPHLDESEGPRLRNGPVSPVRVNFQQENWVQPSNADVEYTQKPSLRGELVDRTLLPLPSPPETAPPPPPHGLRSEPRSFPEFQDDSRGAEGGSEPQLERTNIAEPTKTTPTDRVRNQDQYRNSRESNETASTNPQQISIESSATTSASSLSGMNENVEGQAIGDSPESSIIEGNMPETQPVPLFQYHHQKDFPTSVPSAEARNSSASDLAESASNIGRHLTPNSGSHMRTSLPRPPSSYSVYSDSRGRSPGLLPAGSRKSPDARMSTYAELLHAPYPQQAPAPLTPDNSNLRTVIGNNASLLSTQKTLDMYRANVKKTNDSSIQYSFAIFLISTAQEQGLDFSEPKARKNSPKPQKGRDSPTAEGSVSSPQELVREARQILQRLASAGYPFAQYYLADGFASGLACLSGDLGEKRYREGIKWMKLAAEAADTQYNSAPYQLGCLYENGYGADIFKDDIHAAELFTQAAELGHPEANYRLGDAYEHGLLNCPRDPALSVHFYTGAAERGHAGAMMGLCAWYMVGAPPILEKDEEEAYEWARRSADLGFVKAQYAVGYFTEMGIGCRRDVLEANVWYVKAADAGEERAKQRLAIIQAAVSGQGTPMEVAPPRNGKMQKNPKDDKDCIVM